MNDYNVAHTQSIIDILEYCSPQYLALHGSTPVKNAWRMRNKSKDKWYIIYAKTLEVKKNWMDAFLQERKRVREDHDKGMLHAI